MKTGRFTYGNSDIPYTNAEVSLAAIFTPPYKYSYNQIVSRNSAAQGHMLALPLGTLIARCVTPFLVCKFLNII